jgi:hypothetical protein
MFDGFTVQILKALNKSYVKFLKNIESYHSGDKEKST